MPLIDDVVLGCGGVTVAGGFNVGALATGVGPVGRLFVYDVVPLTLNAAGYAASQSPGAGAITLSAGTGVTATTRSGTTVYQADIPRIVTITSGGNDSGISFTINGFDFYGAAMTQTLTGGNAGAVSSTKAFYQVASVTHTGSVATTVTVGTGDTLGLPYYLKDRVYATGVNWNNTLARDNGTLTVGVTTTASATTGDTRGTYALSSAADGSKRLVLVMAISSAQVGTSATAASVLGVTQF